MKKLKLFNFAIEYINKKYLNGTLFIDKRWMLNDYYKAIETPTSKFVEHKAQCNNVMKLLVKGGYLKSMGEGIYRIDKEIPEISSYQLKKLYKNN